MAPSSTMGLSSRSASAPRRRWWSSSVRAGSVPGNGVRAGPGRSVAPSWWRRRSRRRRRAFQGRERAGFRTRIAGAAARQLAGVSGFFEGDAPAVEKAPHRACSATPAPRARSPDERRSPPGSCPGSLRPAPEPPQRVPRSGASGCRRLALCAGSCPFDIPPSTATTTRRRKSFERGCVMQAGLLHQHAS